MSNKGPKLPKQHKNPRPRKQKAKETTKEVRPLAWLLAIATLIGGLAAVLTFLPRPSVSATDPVDANNPFSSAFTITNNSFVPLRDVSVRLQLGSVKIGTVEIKGGPLFDGKHGGIFTTDDWQNHDLAVDEQFTISPMQVFSRFTFPKDSEFRSGSIAVQIQYKPWLIPLHRSKSFGFHAVRQTNGKFYWYAIPLPPKAN